MPAFLFYIGTRDNISIFKVFLNVGSTSLAISQKRLKLKTKPAMGIT